MHFAIVLSLLSSPLVIHAVSLGDALRYQAGASNFAQTIESSAELSALLRSGSLTIFAPADINSSLTYLQRRDTNNDTTYQVANTIIDIALLSDKPGKDFESWLQDDKLSGNNQSSVAHSGPWADQPAILRSDSGIRRSIGNLTGETITISSGLGNNVSIIRGDIPFDNGIIHVVDE